MEEEKKEPLFKRYTIEQGIQEYEKLEGKFEETFAGLEKFALLDFKKIFLILTGDSRLKELVSLGFSIAKQCNSKVCIIAKKTKSLEEEVEKTSKAMNVEFQYIAEKLEDVIDEIEKERSIVIVPKEIYKQIEAGFKNPILLV